MFVCSQGPMPGMDFAFPDVCMTPAVVPVPIPYPNIALSSTAIPNVTNIFILGMPAHNLMTTGTISQGDMAGVNGGVVSGMVAGPSRHLMGSSKYFISSAPATRMLDPSAQNGMAPNAMGTALAPSQTKMLCLS